MSGKEFGFTTAAPYKAVLQVVWVVSNLLNYALGMLGGHAAQPLFGLRYVRKQAYFKLLSQ